jgi:hypothetical protein
MNKLREWYDGLGDVEQESVDQALHALAGAAISGLVGGVASIWLAGWLAGLIGALVSSAAAGIREAVQNLGDEENHTLGNWIDWGVWTLAGIVVGGAVWGVA